MLIWYMHRNETIVELPDFFDDHSKQESVRAYGTIFRRQENVIAVIPIDVFSICPSVGIILTVRLF